MGKTPKIALIAKNITENPSNYEKVAEILQQKGVSTIDEIVEATSLSKPTVSRCLTQLKKETLVVLMNEKRGRKSVYRWIGGIPALEDELLEATSRKVSASLLAETYDTYISEAFALFSVILENNNWEVITNLKEGLTDTEIHQRVANDISLDSIRRILVICDVHSLIKINRIRESAGKNFVGLFEPLFRVDFVNKNMLRDLVMLRGLAAAIRYEMVNKPKEGYIHPYATLLNLTRNLYSTLIDAVNSTPNTLEKELLEKIIFDVHDFAPDLDRLYRSGDWRGSIKNSENIIIDETSEHILLNVNYIKKYKVSMIKKVGEKNE